MKKPIVVATDNGKTVLVGDISHAEGVDAMATYMDARMRGLSPEEANELAAAKINASRLPN